MPPKRVYWVDYTKGNGPDLKYAEKGGGLFSQLRYAEERAEGHNKKGRDAVVLYADVEWKDPYSE